MLAASLPAFYLIKDKKQLAMKSIEAKIPRLLFIPNKKAVIVAELIFFEYFVSL